MSDARPRSGGRILVDALLAHGVTTVFQVPGESFLPVLDALHASEQQIRIITCRHESGAANMAEAAGKLTGKPGVCFVTRGPGACHASVGVHTAHQDSTPMLLFVGLVDRPLEGREAFQEIDLAAMFGWTAKAVLVITDAARIPEILARAFRLAQSGRPGPVVIGLPEDMQEDEASVHDPVLQPVASQTPAGGDVARVATLLTHARKPLVIAGGSKWSATAQTDLAALATAWDLPVAVTFRRQDRFDNSHCNYVGDLAFAMDPGLARLVQTADLILAVGTRLGDLATKGYSLLRAPNPQQTLIHVFPEPDEIGHVFQPAMGLVADAEPFLHLLRTEGAPSAPAWAAWTEAARQAYRQSLAPGPSPGDLDMNEVMAAVRRQLPADAIVATDAGNFAQWVQRYYPFRHFGTQLGPCGGAMGYGVPAGVAASLLSPGRVVATFVGDGGFMMSASEIATAVQHGATPIFVVINNGMFGTIRAHQERRYPGRPAGTKLQNPDFVRLAGSMGLAAVRVTRTAEFEPALERLLTAGRGGLLELVLDPEVLSSRATLSQIRAAS